jgi:hypothetical protein
MNLIKLSMAALLISMGSLVTAQAACKPTALVGEWNMYFSSPIKTVTENLTNAAIMRCVRQLGRGYTACTLLIGTDEIRTKDQINTAASCKAVISYVMNNSKYNLSGAINTGRDVFAGMLTDESGTSLSSFTAVRSK